MSQTADDLLMLEAEHLARDLLLASDASPKTIASAFAGWGAVIGTGSIFFAGEANPLDQVLAVCRGSARDAREWIGGAAPDGRLRRMAELLEDVATSYPASIAREQHQASALHTCYIATHAVAGLIAQHAAAIGVDQPNGALMSLLAGRVRNAEQILDAHLEHGAPSGRVAAGPAQSLREAIAAWDLALNQALVDQTPDPRVLLVSANASIGLLRRTAGLAALLASGEGPDAANVRLRLMPMVGPACACWEATRDTWRTLAPRTTGITRPIAIAAHTMFRALQSPGLAADSEMPNALRLGLLSMVETAHLHVQAIRRTDLRGAATGVSAQTRLVIEQVPGVRSLDMWRQLERLDGPALIPVPGPVRTELLRQAARTLEAATMAASSGHSLIGEHRGPRQTGDPRRLDLVRRQATSARDLSAVFPDR
jgi:hypothetical protein